MRSKGFSDILYYINQVFEPLFNKEEKITIVFITHDIGVIADDIGRLFTINQKAIICNNPKDTLSCEEMSELYGIDAHLVHNHKHEH